MPPVDRADIQGNVLRGYRFPVARFFFIRVDDPGSGRRWLQSVMPHVTDSEPWDEKPGWALNIAFTHSGLRAVGMAAESLDTFPVEFQQGMRARAQLLGDVDGSSPAHWDAHFRDGDIHVMAVINAVSPDVLHERGAWLENALATADLHVVGTQDTARLAGNREHFGYVDGLSQPVVEGDRMPIRLGQGVTDGTGGWRALRAGEFLLGHHDETGHLPPAPQPSALALNGTFLVYRKLHQRVALFRRFLADQSGAYPGGEEKLAAVLMGRWRDGTPTERFPDGPDALLATDAQRNNDFVYGEDREGFRCPVGSHIRRANPRDGLGFHHRLVHRHRLIRRGMPYGDPLPPGADDDGADRGLIFVCLGASIGRQFEYVQTEWLNDGNIFALGADKDVFAGNHDGTGKMTVPGRPPRFVAAVPRLVTTKGGDYFFLPGIRALRVISGGVDGAAS
jgi:Dyp-type peroxidase family